jgi:PAS domain S-box-containing protein
MVIDPFHFAITSIIKMGSSAFARHNPMRALNACRALEFCAVGRDRQGRVQRYSMDPTNTPDKGNVASTTAWIQSVRDYAVVQLSTDGMVRSWNTGAEVIYGLTRDEALGKPLSDFYTKSDRRKGLPKAALDAATATGSFNTEGWRLRSDGTVFWASVVLSALYGHDGELTGFGNIVRDMTDMKAAHDAALESERRFRMLVQGVTDYAIYMLSPDGIVVNWNAGALRIKGYAEEDVVGSHFSAFYTPEDAAAGLPQRGLAAASNEGRFEAEGWRVRKDGTRFWAHIVIDAIRDERGVLIGFAKITRDITERREANRLLEEARIALFQSQKMEAVGKLTGGVAHDFNNLLQILRGNLELLETRHGRDAWTRERIDKAIDAVDRGANLASQLLAFGRQQPLQPVVINLAGALRGMDDLLRPALGETVDLETVVAGGLWNTQVDVHQLENVVLNLAINARDAMPDGGKLTMELSNAELNDQYVAGMADVSPGQYVLLAVTDTGCGMSTDVAQRAFDPFFTTKPEGQGTGLGLSTAYGFVKQSGGHMRIYSEPGHGTTIKVYLPRSFGTAVEPPAKVSMTLLGGSETILIVEDDKAVQSTAVDTLTGLGYGVLKADNAEQAIAVIRSGVHIDLLFTDVVMPGPLRSPDMAAQAMQIIPRLKVLFTSGYTRNAIVHGGRLDPGVELLSKPYSREQLAFKIRQILGPVPAPRLRGVEEFAAPARPLKRFRILLVDDEVAQSEATGTLLTMSGHVQSTAASPDEALRLAQESDFDILITDISMPGMSGVELAQQLATSMPALRVIFVSGYDIPSDLALPVRWAALRKPYDFDRLIDLLESFDI